MKKGGNITTQEGDEDSFKDITDTNIKRNQRRRVVNMHLEQMDER